MIKKWKQRQQLAKWLKDHGKNLEEINSLLEQWGKGEQVDLITVQQLIENIYIFGVYGVQLATFLVE